MPDQQKKWNERYRQSEAEAGPGGAALILTQNAYLLPDSGVALDLACGLGANALFMAQRGLQVVAWDVSQVAIEKLQHAAVRHQLPLQAQVRDVTEEPPEANRFDVIVITHFLERQLVAGLVDALKAGGLIFYQTFTKEKVSDKGPGNPDYRLGRNELLNLFTQSSFPPLRILLYREEGLVGDISQGFRNEAMLVAQKSN